MIQALEGVIVALRRAYLLVYGVFYLVCIYHDWTVDYDANTV